MFDFAEEVTMTREEWLSLNQALACASLGLRFRGTPADNSLRMDRIRNAQNLMGDIHKRANPEK